MAYTESLLLKCISFTQVQQLHAHLLTTGLFQTSPSMRSKFLGFCATSTISTIAYAASIFRCVSLPLINDWNALIRGHAQSPHPTNALTCFLSMSRAACRPDALTCSFYLKACARAMAFFEAVQVHGQVFRRGFGADVLLETTLVDMYAKCGDLDSACRLFDEMVEKDVATWNALISGLAQGNRPREALKMFHKMKSGDGTTWPNEITVLGVLSACSQLGAVTEGDKVYDYVRNHGWDRNVIVCNAVIDMYSKCGLVDKAHGVFETMRCSRSLITWNTLIMGFAMDGNGKRALQLFWSMVGAGLEPDDVSFLAVLCACNHAGMVDEGEKLFEMMGKYNVTKNVKHYGSVVDLLGRAGKLNKAYEIIESMPFFPDVVLWQTLLGACKKHGDVGMAEKASRKLVEMGSKTCGDFVLLSNVYAAHERWSDVGRVREAMKRRNVKKVPGFSYTEINGVMYQFYNGDKSHHNWREIYQKLEEIGCKIREIGYEAETDNVLHDIGQEEKENALFFHSEKLALAFGLISTGEGSTININKNLRICGDCHVVIKLVSKLYNREIIIRDRSRFHRFVDGSCSCGDYW